MKSWASLLLLIVLAWAASGQQEESNKLLEAEIRQVRSAFPEVPVISTDELAAWLADTNRAPPLLLDTRSEEEFRVSHLDGARRIDPDGPTAESLAGLARETSIVTYCSVGYRSARVARRLQAMGFTRVLNLEGSLFKWANEGRELVQDGKPVSTVHPYNRFWGRLLDDIHRAGGTSGD